MSCLAPSEHYGACISITEMNREEKGNITKDVLQHCLFSALKLQCTISFFKTFMIHHVVTVAAVLSSVTL